MSQNHPFIQRRLPRRAIARLALIGFFLIFQFVYGGQTLTVHASAPAAPNFCSATTTNFSNTTSGTIPDNNTIGVSRTISVSGVGNYLWDVDVTINVSHTNPADLDIWLTSPAGTVVTLTTDNGGNNDNVFQGTTFDDDADPGNNTTSNPSSSLRVNDTSYVNNVVKALLTPEEPLAAFVGENPNGNWTLTVADDQNGTTGTLNSWSISVTHLNGTVVTTSSTFSNTTAQTISSSGTPTVTSNIAASGLSNVITKVTVTTNILHTRADNLDIAVLSPAGTYVTLTTDNGGANDNVFAGTVWDDDADPDNNTRVNAGSSNRVADTSYANNVVEATLTPEEPLGAFIGETPNGTWSLIIADDANGDGGSLASWSITITTGNCYADVSVTKVLDTAAPYYAGNNVQYTVTVSNTNVNAALNATMTDTLESNLTFVSLSAPSGWSCTTPSIGASGLISCSNPSLSAGASAVFTVVAKIPSSVANGTTISNFATSIANNDITSGNNTTLPILFNTSVAADLSVTKTDGQTSDTPGTSITYTIVVSNAGPSDATGVTVTDTLPTALTGATWTCVGTGGGTCTASGSGNISDSANLPAGGNVTYTLTATISPAATGTLSNTATITSAIDSTSGNNDAVDDTTLTPQADLSITKTDGQTSDVPGTSITYTVVVSNAGPSDATGVTVTDTLPTALTGATWTCVGTGGGTCTASGSGNLSDSANIPAGGNVTYTLTATISPAATGTLSNTATITSAIDSTSGNNDAVDETTLTPQADLSVTKTDGQTSDVPGTSITYTVVVSNAGPSDAPSVTVTDTLPTTLTGATWTCVGTGGGTCTASGSGDISDSANLPAGGNVTYTLTATISPAATGTLSNTATITSAIDSTSGNNEALDETTLTPQADLSITKTAGAPTTVQGANITYTITVNNAGPSAASVTLTDALPAATTFVSLTAPSGWSCTTPAVDANGTVSCENTALAVTEDTFTLVVKVNLNAVGNSTISNTAEIASAADSSAGNNSQQADVTVGAPQLTSWAKPANLIQLNGLAGTTPSINIAVSNTGATGTNLNVTLTTPPGSPFTVTALPLNIAAGAQAFYTVGCAVTGTPASGNFTITTNEPGSPTYTYNLSCTTSADVPGVFRPSAAVFHLRYSNTSGPANHSVAVGLGTDTPMVGDWNNDSADTVGVFRPSSGQFFLRDTNQVGGATAYNFTLGAAGDIPLAGDFNGDGQDDVGFFRPSTQQFLFRYSKSAGPFDAVIKFGLATDIPIVGDWDGDGRDTPGVYRNGYFYLTNRFTSTASPAPINVTVRYGLAGDIPLVGDWDGNGTVTVGVYRGNVFLLRNSNTAGPVDLFIYYGLSGDKPVVGNWLKPGAVLPIRPPQQPTAPTFTPKQ
jgi:uncharacterized repeat protein (TIGR01451 family)